MAATPQQRTVDGRGAATARVTALGDCTLVRRSAKALRFVLDLVKAAPRLVLLVAGSTLARPWLAANALAMMCVCVCVCGVLKRGTCTHNAPCQLGGNLSAWWLLHGSSANTRQAEYDANDEQVVVVV